MGTMKKVVVAVAAVVVCAVLVCGAGLYSQAFAKNRLVPVYCVDTSEDKCAISFDAAWGADKTRKIMDVCDSYGVKATFFLVGFWVDKYPEVVKEIAERKMPDLTANTIEAAMSQVAGTCRSMGIVVVD